MVSWENEGEEEEMKFFVCIGKIITNIYEFAKKKFN
jgi:hypothetical protein